MQWAKRVTHETFVPAFTFSLEQKKSHEISESKYYRCGLKEEEKKEAGVRGVRGLLRLAPRRMNHKPGTHAQSARENCSRNTR